MLLEGCPSLSLLVTSREALRIRPEHEIQVAPLALPAAGQRGSEATRSPAVQLLLQRAEASAAAFLPTDEHLRIAAEICRRLDGLPLALELAAAQLRYMPAEILLSRLDAGLAMLAEGPRDLPQRQQSLRGAIGWSYDLLDEPERALFEDLASFRDGGTIEAVCQVHLGGVDGMEATVRRLRSLSDKSLVEWRASASNDQRVQMLETIREYAWERFEPRVDAPAVRERHAAFYASLAWETGLTLAGPGREATIARLDNERGNMATAFLWAVQTGADRLALRLAGSLGFYWIMRGEIAEGSRWIASALTLDSSGASTEERARAYYCAAGLAWKREEHILAGNYAMTAVGLARQLPSQRLLALALALQGLIATSQEALDSAIENHLASLDIFESMNDRWGSGYALSNLGDAMLETGNLKVARDYYRQGLEAFVAANDAWGQGVTLHATGNASWRSGQYEAARIAYHDAAERFRGIANREGLGRALASEAAALLRRRSLGDLDLAASLLHESLDHWQSLGITSGMALAIEGLAAVAAERGAPDRAVELFRAVDAARQGRRPLFVVEPDLFNVQRASAFALASDPVSQPEKDRGPRGDLETVIATL